MRPFLFVPTHRNVSRQEWKKMDRLSRLVGKMFAKQIEEASLTSVIYGAAIVTLDETTSEITVSPPLAP